MKNKGGKYMWSILLFIQTVCVYMIMRKMYSDK
nr:MAG TPA: hypothetical protein [Caudoviricetes sp.]